MEFQKGKVYIAYHKENPFKYFTFKVLNVEEFFIEGEVLEGIINIEYWQTYTVKVPGKDDFHRYLEVSPYFFDEKEKRVKLIVLGYLVERRRFVRFNVKSFSIPVKSKYFEGVLENISLGGVKISVIKWLNKDIKEGHYVLVESNLEGKNYKFIIKPVKVDFEKNFISAAFEGPNDVTLEYFHKCLQALNKQLVPIEERRKFRRFYVEPLNIMAETPLGKGILVDISLKGLKLKLQKEYNVDEDIIKKPFLTAIHLPWETEDYILNTQLVNKTDDGFISLKITKWDKDALKFVSKVLEKLSFSLRDFGIS